VPVVKVEFADQIASTVSNTTINQFQKWLREGSLVLRPPFQRNLVWNDSQRAFLIDSILRGLPVPEVYVQTRTSAEGEESVTVVDGQQRISACLAFLHGELRLSNDEEFDGRWRSKTFKELHPDLQERFRGYELLVRKLPKLEEPVLREIFRRLNRTVEPLVAQELRHAAYTGPFISFVERAGAHPVLGEVGVFTARDYLRRRSDELMSEIAFAVSSKAFPNKKEGLENLFLTYEKQGIPDEVLEDLIRRFGRVYVQLEPIAGRVRRTRFRNKSDFYSLFIALARNAEQLPLPEDGDDLADRLREFSDRVNDIKREEGEQRPLDDLISDEIGKAAIRYLRAVERAASDRLSRVRRNEALLSAVIGPAVAAGPSGDLSPEDDAWFDSTEAEVAEDEGEDGDDEEETLVVANETLLASADDSVEGPSPEGEI
jgi:hypothetical protein